MLNICQWTETEPQEDGTMLPRRRAFVYDEENDVILDYHNDEIVNKIPLQVLADKDPSIMKTYEARKVVKFCKKKLGIA